MQDGKQLSTTFDPPQSHLVGRKGAGVVLATQQTGQGALATTRESLRHCPVAQRLFDQTGGTDGIPTAALAVIAAADRSITTAAESAQSTGQVSVRRFVKDFDERSLSALILTHLTIVEDMVNVARPMKPEAMALLAKNVAKLLTDDDMTVNLADIQIVADRLANGEAGQVFGGLNAPMVMKAFTDYMCEKANAFADLRERQAREQYGSWGERSGDTRAADLKKHREAMHEYQLGKLRVSS